MERSKSESILIEEKDLDMPFKQAADMVAWVRTDIVNVPCELMYKFLNSEDLIKALSNVTGMFFGTKLGSWNATIIPRDKDWIEKYQEESKELGNSKQFTLEVKS